MEKTKKISTIIILTMLLLVSMPLLTLIEPADSYVIKIKTYAYAFVSPNPAQVGQQVVVTFRIDKALANSAVNRGLPTGFIVKITGPDNRTEEFGPLTGDSTGGSYFTYTPTQVGTYYIETSFPGQWDNFTSGIQRWYEPSISDKLEFIVQEDPIPDYPLVPLPSSYWERPVYGENKGWYTIMDNWLQPRYDYAFTVTRVCPAFAPYTSAPNSAHILWAKPLWIGGIAGGQHGDKVYYTGLVYEEPYEPIIQAGRIYFNYHDQTSTTAYGAYCLDLYTGEEIYFLNRTTINFAQDLAWDSPNEHGVLPYLWSTSGTTWRMLDPITGEERLRVTNVPTGYIKMGPNGEVLTYSVDLTRSRLIMWNSTKAIVGVGNQFWSPAKGTTIDGTNGIEWNVSIPTLPVRSGLGAGIVCVDEGYILMVYPDTVTGDNYVFTTIVFPADLTKDSNGDYPTILNYLWMANRTDLFRAYLPTYYNIEDGVYAEYSEDDHVIHCYSIETGKELWKTKVEGANVWTGFSYNKVVAYGKIYLAGYDGHVRAWHIANGSLAWDTWFGNSGKETVYDTYPVHNGMTVADHKIYISNDEHSPDAVMWRGSKLWCIDAETGKVLWKTGGWLRRPAISDGILTAVSGYDNQIYTFGRGPSKTTVSAPQTEVTLGQSILITGTITDQTSGPYCKTKDTACISDESMGEWMDYIYCQKPMPQNATGVQMKLYVIDANNNYRHIGSTTSDTTGFYSYQWTPDIPGKYTVIATFEGTNSYYPSSATGAFVVVEPEATPTPTSTPPPSMADLYFMPMSVALLIAIIAVGIAMVLMMRKKP